MTSYDSLSLWWDTLPSDLAGPLRPSLPGDRDADVVIVGAGYTGLWTAHSLLSHDPALRVVVLEKEVAGFGASGRNGGWCSALFPSSPAAVAKLSSRTASLALHRALEDTVDEVGKVADAEGIDCHFSKGGTVSLVRSATQEERARRALNESTTWATDETWLTADEVGRRVRATSVRGATYTPHCAAIHPARLARGLALAVERRGGVIHEHTPVVSLEPGVARTPFGDVRAPHVIRATEAFTPTLPGHRRTIAPVYSLMLATEPLPEETWAEIGLEYRETFNDYRHLIIYGQRTVDGRFAFGGRGAPYHYGSTIRPEFDREPRVFESLRDVLVDLFPSVRDAAITHTWGGPVGVARDWMASVGLDRRTGVGWAGGYVGDGVGASNLAGRTLADLVLGRDTELVHLPWVDHRSRRWEPEPLRWIGTNVALRTMTGADETEERTGRPSRRAALVSRLLGE